MPPKVSFLKFTQGEAIRNYYHERHVCQDLLVPINKIGDALELNDKDLEVCAALYCMLVYSTEQLALSSAVLCVRPYRTVLCHTVLCSYPSR